MTDDWLASSDDWHDDDNQTASTIDFDELPEYGTVDDDPEDDAASSYAGDFGTSASEDDEQMETLLVTATNPGGSITATGFIDGRVFQIRLSPQVIKMTEAELAAEIFKVCNLTTRQAEAAQHYLIATVMSELGHDPAATRAFLEHTIGLPTPGTVIDEKARMYAEHNATGD